MLLLAGCFTASAQEYETKEEFNPHWYVQAQAGFQHTLGEIKTSKLNSLNTQVALGYQFDKLFGARFTVGGWTSRGGVNLKGNDYRYHWNYVAPTVDLTFDVTNAILGYNPKRIVSFGIFAGGGLNIAWHNQEAGRVDATIKSLYPIAENQVEFMHYLWDGTKTRVVGQFGANLDFKVSDRVSIGAEANCNFLKDRYNSKKAGNVDWYFNVLGGIKVALGPTSKSVNYPVPVRERIVEKVVTVHDTITVEKERFTKDPLRRDIFFTICNSEVSKAEMPKVEDIAEYLNRFPESKVSIVGYADKGTGTPKGNIVYAKKRAQMIADLLINKFGINPNRISVDSKGDTVQPFDINDLNRVSICVAE